jgi:flotillin
MSLVGVLIIVLGLIAVIFLLFLVSARLFHKVGPNEALIVYGLGGTKVVKGGGRIVWPMIQQARELSLELMSFDVAPTQDLYSSQGVAVNVEAVAQIKVQSDPISILTASEQFLNKSPEQREALIRLVMEGHLRGIVGQLTVEHIVKEPEMVADRMRANVADDMNKMGLEVISFTIKEVRDKNDYILNMGRPDVALVKRTADIATAEADRDTTIRRAQAERDARIAEAEADQQKIIAETASQTRQAEAQRDLEMKRADYLQSVQVRKAVADKAYEIETNVQQQKVIAEQVKIEQIRIQSETGVQEAEIKRREMELQATIIKQAEAERQKIETLAEADRQREVIIAKGLAEATRLQGNAEAEIIFAQGKAEADAMDVKARAYQEYNQAAILDKLVASLPEVVRALSEPLAKVDRITVVSTGADGGSEGAGVNRITNDMATMIAQVPAILESLTGVKIADLLSQVPQIAQATNGHSNGVAKSADGSAQESRPVAENTSVATVPAPEKPAAGDKTSA